MLSQLTNWNKDSVTRSQDYLVTEKFIEKSSNKLRFIAEEKDIKGYLRLMKEELIDNVQS